MQNHRGIACRARRAGLLAALALVLVLAAAVPALADSGTVTVTATNLSKLTLTISDTTAVFGSDLEPEGTTSADGENVVGLAQAGVGSYYVWKSASDAGVTVTVRSNKTWNGTVSASENSGTATSMTIASGVLRFTTSEPASYAQAAAGTAFSTDPATVWQSSVGKGTSQYTYFYCLRVNWADDPGTFGSTVTYNAIQ